MGAPRRRRWLLALVCIVLPAALVRGCVLSTFVIRSDSMTPTLQEGDHLLVLRDGVDLRELRRWDVVVMDRDLDAQVPEAYDAVVKRVAALPGESVQVRDGDVWAGPADDRLALVAKPDELVERLLVEVAAGPGLPPPWNGAGALGVEAGAEGARLSPGPAGRPAAFGQAVLADDQPVRDTAVEVELARAGTGALILGLREGADVFRARLGSAASGGGAALIHNLGGGELVADPEFPGLRDGQRVRFWNVDDRLRLFVDGRLVLARDGVANTPQPPGTTLMNAPELGVGGPGWVVARTAVLRDLHYLDDGTYGTGAGGLVAVCRVLPGEVFLLGDRSARSRDSRHVGAVSLEGLLGRPLAIYRPVERAGWVTSAGVPSP